MKPILKYSGGKAREIKKFKSYIPKKYDTYYEAFVGGGAVYFYLEPKKAVINDINTRLIKFYQELASDYDTVSSEIFKIQKQYEKNAAEFKAHPSNDKSSNKNSELYYRFRDIYNGKIQSPYEFATVYYVINHLAYNGIIRYNRKGEFNVPFGFYKTFNVSTLSSNVKDLLQRTTITNGNYLNSFKQATSDDFMFLDPPYDSTFNSYGNGSDFSEEQQRKLAEDFKNLSCRALMIIGETPLITELYQGYIKDGYHKNYVINIKNRFKSDAKHLIITNY